MPLQLKTAIGRATSRSDMPTIRDALEVSAEMYKKDANNVPDYVQRHLISLSIWEELRYVPFHFLPVSNFHLFLFSFFYTHLHLDSCCFSFKFLYYIGYAGLCHFLRLLSLIHC